MRELRGELARVGIRGRLARRIVLEVEDHERCNPEANLGEPRLIAERFADELRLPATRQAAQVGFASLALAAVLLGVSQRTMSVAGGFPDVFDGRGSVVALAGLAMALAGQVAFVAGVLAVWRLWQRPRGAASLRLVQRRVELALLAGGVVAAGEVAQAVALQPLLPRWWLALALTTAAAPMIGFAGAASRLRLAAGVTPAVVPEARPFPRELVIAIGIGAVSLMAVGSTVAEHSWIEGVWRGGIEAVAFVACFLALGRFLGIRRPRA